MSDNRDKSAVAPAPRRSAKGAPVEVDGATLPAFCPNPAMTLWNEHPRVFLDLAHTGKAMCPYCGTEYVLKPGTAPAGH